MVNQVARSSSMTWRTSDCGTSLSMRGVPMSSKRIQRTLPWRFFLSSEIASWIAAGSTCVYWRGNAYCAMTACCLLACLWAKYAQVVGDPGRAVHADGDCLAVQVRLITGGRFQGVANGMAVVEERADALLFGVFRYDLLLPAHAPRDDLQQEIRRKVAGASARNLRKKWRIEEQRRLDDLRPACEQVSLGEGLQKADIDTRNQRRVEGADEIFAFRQVYGYFPPDAAVDLRYETSSESARTACRADRWRRRTRPGRRRPRRQTPE